MLDRGMLHWWRRYRSLQTSAPIRRQMGMTLSEWREEPAVFTAWAVEFAKLDGD